MLGCLFVNPHWKDFLCFQHDLVPGFIVDDAVSHHPVYFFESPNYAASLLTKQLPAGLRIH